MVRYKIVFMWIFFAVLGYLLAGYVAYFVTGYQDHLSRKSVRCPPSGMGLRCLEDGPETLGKYMYRIVVGMTVRHPDYLVLWPIYIYSCRLVQQSNASVSMCGDIL